MVSRERINGRDNRREEYLRGLAAREAEVGLDKANYSTLKFEIRELVNFFCENSVSFYETASEEKPASQTNLQGRCRMLKDLLKDYSRPGSVWANKVREKKPKRRSKQLGIPKSTYSKWQGELLETFMRYINRSAPRYTYLIVAELEDFFYVRGNKFEQKVEEVLGLGRKEFDKQSEEDRCQFYRTGPDSLRIPKRNN